MRRMKKALQEKFRRQAKAVIQRLGGIAKSSHEFTFDTKYGPLRLSVDELGQNEGPGTVFTRFENAVTASPVAGGPPHNGKWNHHYFAPWTVETAIADLEANLRRVLPSSLDDFTNATSLVVHIVVQTAIAERTEASRCPHWMQDPLWVPQDRWLSHDAAIEWFTVHAERRVIFVYDTNSHLQKRLESDCGRDVLYAFIHHWLDAYLEDPPKYREQHQLIPARDALVI